MVLHCGDIEDPPVVELFRGLNAHFVLGNCDLDADALAEKIEEVGATLHENFGIWRLMERRSPLFTGTRDRLLDDLVQAGCYDYLFHGHTHVRKDCLVGPTRVINPGACIGRRSRRSPCSIRPAANWRPWWWSEDGAIAYGARTTTPPFITSFTFRSALISRTGSPSTAVRSASNPGFTAPSLSFRCSAFAATDVAAQRLGRLHAHLDHQFQFAGALAVREDAHVAAVDDRDPRRQCLLEHRSHRFESRTVPDRRVGRQPS